jgi:hypothetical protein
VEGILKHQIKLHDDYCETKTWGHASYTGFLNIVKELTGHPKWRPGMPILADHRELDFSGISDYLKIEALASIHVRHKNKLGKVRLAVILKPGSAEIYVVDMEEMAANIRQNADNAQEYPVEHKVFFDKEEALDWLMSKEARGGPSV